MGSWVGLGKMGWGRGWVDTLPRIQKCQKLKLFTYNGSMIAPKLQNLHEMSDCCTCECDDAMHCETKEILQMCVCVCVCVCV